MSDGFYVNSKLGNAYPATGVSYNIRCEYGIVDRDVWSRNDIIAKLIIIEFTVYWKECCQ
jgi:hypothetical protein